MDTLVIAGCLLIGVAVGSWATFELMTRVGPAYDNAHAQLDDDA